MKSSRLSGLLLLLLLLPAAPALAQESPEEEGPRFIARDVDPVLENKEEVVQLLDRYYPDALRLTGKKATVILWVYVSEEGKVEKCQVLKSGGHPQFDEAAEKVAYAMRWKPAVRGEEPVAVWIQQAINFVPGDPKIREQ